MAVRWLDISENRRRRRRGEKSPTANVSTQERCKAFHKAGNHGRTLLYQNTVVNFIVRSTDLLLGLYTRNFVIMLYPTCRKLIQKVGKHSNEIKEMLYHALLV